MALIEALGKLDALQSEVSRLMSRLEEVDGKVGVLRREEGRLARS